MPLAFAIQPAGAGAHPAEHVEGGAGLPPLHARLAALPATVSVEVGLQQGAAQAHAAAGGGGGALPGESGGARVAGGGGWPLGWAVAAGAGAHVQRAWAGCQAHVARSTSAQQTF